MQVTLKDTPSCPTFRTMLIPSSLLRKTQLGCCKQFLAASMAYASCPIGSLMYFLKIKPQLVSFLDQIQPPWGKQGCHQCHKFSVYFFAGHFMQELSFHADILNTTVGHSTCIVNHTLFLGDKTIEESWLILYGNHEVCSQILPFSSVGAWDSLRLWIRRSYDPLWPIKCECKWQVVLPDESLYELLWVTHHVATCLRKDEDALDDGSFISLGLWARKM